MSIENIILDFDGTITDVQKEGKPHREKFIAGFCQALGINNNRIFQRQYETIEQSVKADPTIGWVVNEQDIAPACSDPYVLNKVVMQEIVSQLKQGKLDGVLDYDKETLASTDYNVFSSELFKNSYDPTVAFFRQGKRESRNFINKLIKMDLGINIVTTSSTDSVIQKFLKLGDFKNVIPIEGNAKKYINNPKFREIEPASVTPNAFPRKVLLRREHYFNKLKELEKTFGFTPQSTVVIGDIYELDLALPEHLGYRVIQMFTPFTPAYEAAYHLQKPNNAFVQSYEAVLWTIEQFNKVK